MLVDISLCVVTTLLEVFLQRALMSPSPVVRPQVYVHVVDILVGAYLLIERHVVLASPAALGANGYKVVLVKRANQRRSLCQPLGKWLFCLLAKGARLVAYLPRHDGWVFCVFLARVSISAADDVAHILIEQLMSLLTRGVFADEIHKL